MVTIMKNGWGRDDPFARRVFTDAFLPESTPEQQRWFDDLQRVSCSPETALRLMTEVGNINVLDLLPKLTVPTLVLHSKGDLVIPSVAGIWLDAFRTRDLFLRRGETTSCYPVSLL